MVRMNCRTLVRLSVIVLLSAGCTIARHGGGGQGASQVDNTQRTSQSEALGASTETEADQESLMQDGFFRPASAPHPLACQSDDDCVYGGAVDQSGCCWSYRDMNAVAMSAAYRRWLSEHREAACDLTRCPPPRVPAGPPACLFDVRCEDARCVNACR